MYLLNQFSLSIYIILRNLRIRGKQRFFLSREELLILNNFVFTEKYTLLYTFTKSLLSKIKMNSSKFYKWVIYFKNVVSSKCIMKHMQKTFSTCFESNLVFQINHWLSWRHPTNKTAYFGKTCPYTDSHKGFPVAYLYREG